jgi:two-component system chemotaxis sensor kinase CheA
VRNSVGHGIELEADRIKAGKNPMGTVTLSAKNEKDAIIIDIIDDGKGIDPNIIKKIALKKGVITEDVAKTLSDNDAMMLIFEPGFSSAEVVTSVSGRGVGMDVVKKSLQSVVLLRFILKLAKVQPCVFVCQVLWLLKEHYYLN